jgi:ribosome-associated protein
MQGGLTSLISGLVSDVGRLTGLISALNRGVPSMIGARMLPLLIRGVLIPAQAMSMHAVRSGGPGGQNVNKVASKVELRVDLTLIEGMTVGAIGRLRALAAARLDAEGRLLVSSQASRDQHANLEDARSKIAALVFRALHEPKRRRATRPTRGSVERRIADKKRRGDKKATRRPDET